MDNTQMVIDEICMLCDRLAQDDLTEYDILQIRIELIECAKKLKVWQDLFIVSNATLN